MANTPKKQSKAAEAADLIMLFLMDGYDKRFVTIEVLQAATGITGQDLVNGIRQLATSVGAIKYSRKGEYEIVDLDRYFEDTEPGAHDRYHSRYLVFG